MFPTNPNFRNNNNFNNNYNNELVLETTVDGRIIPVRDGEAMVSEIEIGPFKIVVIANIPEEGKTTAPCYLKFKMNDGRSAGGYRRRFPRPDRFQNQAQVEYVNRDQTPEADEEDDGSDGGGQARP